MAAGVDWSRAREKNKRRLRWLEIGGEDLGEVPQYPQFRWDIDVTASHGMDAGVRCRQANGW